MSYLFDVDTLVSERNHLLQKEAEDRALVDTIEFPDMQMLREKLVEWATEGFREGYAIFSITIDVPPTCSDGIRRSLFDYVSFVAGIPIAEKMQRLTDKLNGMHVMCSYSGTTITFHVFKGKSS